MNLRFRSLMQFTSVCLILTLWNISFISCENDSNQDSESGSSSAGNKQNKSQSKDNKPPFGGKTPEELRNIQMLKRKEREKENIMLARKTLKIGSDDKCDWRYQPLEFIKGEICGAHYKVLGLERKKLTDLDNGNKNKLIKKSYRHISLSVHPDKNPSAEASEAFKMITNAYECLSDDNCKRNYDSDLDKVEESIAFERQITKKNIFEKLIHGANQAHYYVSVTCMYIFQTGMDLWELAGEFEVPFLGEQRPIGKIVMAAALLLKGRWILQIYSLSYVLVRINYELAKQRGLM